MKIRTDFVTNSSSSSFILGNAKESRLNKSEGIKYLESIQQKLNLKDPIQVDFIVDLKYDPTIRYNPSDVSFVAEAIEWYYDESYIKDAKTEDYCIELATDDGSSFEVNSYRDDYTTDEIKAIFDFAHQIFGEILIGSSEMPFQPYQVYDCIQDDPNIKFACNHMG